jgi:hypothetical protein
VFGEQTFPQLYFPGPQPFSRNIFLRNFALSAVVLLAIVAPGRCHAAEMLAIGTKFLATHRLLAPLVALPGALVALQVVDEDVDGGPPGGAAGSSGSGHHRSMCQLLQKRSW